MSLARYAVVPVHLHLSSSSDMTCCSLSISSEDNPRTMSTLIDCVQKVLDGSMRSATSMLFSGSLRCRPFKLLRTSERWGLLS
jgi:hypothetical protein